MQQTFSEFLNDNNTNDSVFETKYNNVKIHKEKYNDRFSVIYSKKDSKGLKQEEYSISGYYDIVDKVLYNSSYDISDIIARDNSITLDNFDNVFSKMCKEIDEYISDYVLLNADEYRKLGQEKYNNLDRWTKENSVKNVETKFIETSNPDLKMPSAGVSYKIRCRDEYFNKNVINDYLNDPQKVIEKYATEFIEKDKEELGSDLLIYDYQLSHLEKIKENKNNEFDHIYINKKIIESIKDIDAKNVMITINYDGKEITFKYDYNKFNSQLKSATYKGYEYGSNYDKVRNFLKDNDVRDERGYHEDNFLFKNISSITYSKKVLYENEKLKSEIELDNDDFDLER